MHAYELGNSTAADGSSTVPQCSVYVEQCGITDVMVHVDDHAQLAKEVARVSWLLRCLALHCVLSQKAGMAAYLCMQAPMINSQQDTMRL